MSNLQLASDPSAPETDPSLPQRSDEGAAVRLNLGAGDVPLPGFVPVDRACGTEVYPLPYPDSSVEEVYASHVLEHFPMRDAEKVVAEWVRVLKPGGRIRIAVPDVRALAHAIVANANMPITAFLYGGQTDPNDFHKNGFDESGLRWFMEKAGLVGIQHWKSDIKDCAALPISLNLEGYKPLYATDLGARCTVVATMPALNHTDNRDCTTLACVLLGINYRCTSGAYFDQGMERALEEAMGVEYAIAIDYDTIYTPEDLQRLIVLMDRHPEAGAIAAMQAQRGPDGKLLIARDEHDVVREEEAQSDVFKVKSAHFGLTAIRTSVLKKMGKPWLYHKPAPDGSWGPGRIDADVGFWHKMREIAPVYVSPRINVGHLQRMVTWVDGSWKAIHQHLQDWRENGKPETVRG